MSGILRFSCFPLSTQHWINPIKLYGLITIPLCIRINQFLINMQNMVISTKYVEYVTNIPSCRLAEKTFPSLSGSIVWRTVSEIVGNVLKGMSSGFKPSWMNAWLSITRTQKHITHDTSYVGHRLHQAISRVDWQCFTSSECKCFANRLCESWSSCLHSLSPV